MNSIEFLKKVFYHLFIYELMNHHSRIISSTINFYNFRVKFNDIHPIMNRLIWFVISNVRKWFSFNESITIKIAKRENSQVERNLLLITSKKKFRQRPRSYYEGIRVWLSWNYISVGTLIIDNRQKPFLRNPWKEFS